MIYERKYRIPLDTGATDEQVCRDMIFRLVDSIPFEDLKRIFHYTSHDPVRDIPILRKHLNDNDMLSVSETRIWNAEFNLLINLQLGEEVQHDISIEL